MSFMQVAHAIGTQLGPGTGMRVAHDDNVTIEWDTGLVVLLHVTDDDDPSDPGHFHIFYARQDSFGRHGNGVSLFNLPRSSTPDQLAQGLLVAMHAQRTQTPIPSPWRWGLLVPTMTTAFADELAARKITIRSVTDLHVRAELERRDASTCRTFISWDRDQGQWTILLYLAGEDSDSTGIFRRFTAHATPTLIANFITYWSTTTDDELTLPPLVHTYPFPLPRVGLAHGEDAGLGQMIEAVHGGGYEVLRVDLTAVNPAAGLAAKADVISFRDDERRMFMLTRGHGRGAVWVLYALMVVILEEDEDAHDPLNLIPTPQPWAPDADDPYSLPVASTAPELVAAAITTLIESLPATGDADTALDVPQGFWSPDLVFLGEAALSTALGDLEEATARALGISGGVALPEPALIRTPHDAEQAAAAWMRVMGFPDAAATPVGPDEGIDVTAREAVAQVKTETVPVGRPALQQLAGVAHGVGKQGLFFSLSGYRAGAVEWAERVGMPLFDFDYQGIPQPANDAAIALLVRNDIPVG